MFKPLTPAQRRFGWLVSHTREDGLIEIPLTGEANKDALLRHWATGKGRFIVDEFLPNGNPIPFQVRGDAWEEPATYSEWVRS